MLKLFVYIGYVLLAINLMLFIKGFLIEKKAFKIFTLYLFTIAVIELVSGILFHYKENNLFISHFYFISQFLLLSLFYFQILNNSFQKKIIKIAVPLCLLILGVQYYFNRDLFCKFNLFEIFITSFFIIIFSMFHFYNILNEKRVYYYINTGIFIYLFGSTFLFITGNLINTLTNNFRTIIWTLNGILYIIYQVYIFIELKKSFLNNKSNNE